MTRKAKLFNGMGYREVQRSNSNRRNKLEPDTQKQLKKRGYKNIGWNNVIQLYQKIDDLLAELESDGPTLEDLFLQADRIGSKYQTPEEIKAFNAQLNREVAAIADEIDKQFPEPESEFIDYSKQPNAVKKATRKNSH